MELSTLRYFLAVAREENMTNAAASLHISQPALSYQMARLEEELGKQLFIRTNRNMELTEDGMFLLSRAEEIISLADQTYREIQNEPDEIRGDVYIGAAESKAIHFIAEVIAEIRKKYPHIIFHFYSGNYDDVYSRISHGSLDFAIMIEPFPFQNLEKIELPSKDRTGIIIPKDHPLAGRKCIRAEDLRNLPLIMAMRSYMNKADYADQFDIPESELNIAATGNLIYNLAILAEHRIGAILSLEGLVHTGDDSELVFIPFEPKIERTLVLTWKQNRPLNRAAEVFLNTMREKIDEKL